MKLGDIYITCKNSYDAVAGIKASDTQANKGVAKKIYGWGGAYGTLLELRNIKYLESQANKMIRAVPQIFVEEDSFEVAVNVGQMITREKENLLRSMLDVIHLVESMGLHSENQVGFSMKLPACKDFSEYAQYIVSINQFFERCPLLRAEGEEIRFHNVDVGSNWLTFFIEGVEVMSAGSVLIKNLLEILDKCIIIKQRRLELEKQKRELEREERNENDRQVILKYLTYLYEREIKTAIQDIEDKTSCKLENKDGDEYGRMKNSLETMGDLIEQGLQIYSSIDAPKEVKQLYAPLERKFLSVGKQTELIEEKGEEEDGEQEDG